MALLWPNFQWWFWTFRLLFFLYCCVMCCPVLCCYPLCIWLLFFSDVEFYTLLFLGCLQLRHITPQNLFSLKLWQNKNSQTFVVMLSFCNFFCSRQLMQIQKKTCKNWASQTKVDPSYFDRALVILTKSA